MITGASGPVGTSQFNLQVDPELIETVEDLDASKWLVREDGALIGVAAVAMVDASTLQIDLEGLLTAILPWTVEYLGGDTNLRYLPDCLLSAQPEFPIEVF